MKKHLVFISALTVLMAACNTQGMPAKEDTSGHQAMDQSHQDRIAASNTSGREASIANSPAKYTQVDASVSSFVKGVLAHYLQLESALVVNNEQEAAKHAQQISNELKALDKSTLSSIEKKDFDQIVPELNRSAGLIAQSKLDVQRKNFVSLSNSVYSLVKTFEAGRAVYQVYCPMYEGGASWISDSKEIQNPYYGKEMLNCGTVKEMIQ